MTAETYGPALMSTVTIDAPGRICHGKRGVVVSLHLATNEMTVQVNGGTRHILPWDAETPGLRHGSLPMYRRGCRCTDCVDRATEVSRINTRRRVMTFDSRGVTHGEVATYRRGCRCAKCREAKRVAAQKYR